MRKMMQPWIIEELWRREEDERYRREQRHREQIQIDAPDGEMHDDESSEDLPKRGVLIIEL
jgi:hypothetical protein